MCQNALILTESLASNFGEIALTCSCRGYSVLSQRWGAAVFCFQPEQLVCVALHFVVQQFTEKELESDFSKANEN